MIFTHASKTLPEGVEARGAIDFLPGILAVYGKSQINCLDVVVLPDISIGIRGGYPPYVVYALEAF